MTVGRHETHRIRNRIILWVVFLALVTPALITFGNRIAQGADTCGGAVAELSAATVGVVFPTPLIGTIIGWSAWVSAVHNVQSACGLQTDFGVPIRIGRFG